MFSNQLVMLPGFDAKFADTLNCKWCTEISSCDEILVKRIPLKLIQLLKNSDLELIRGICSDIFFVLDSPSKYSLPDR